MKRRLLAGCLLALFPVTLDAEISPSGLLRALVQPSTKRQAAFAPIALPKDEEHLNKAFVTRQTQWLEKQLLLDFSKRNAGSAWLDDAVEVLRGVACHLANGYESVVIWPDSKAPESLLKKARAVRAAG